MPANRDLVPNQFGDPTLTQEEAYAACGPAAAVAFARATGRNPTLREALDLAKRYGWTAAGGMNGVGNQKRLLDAMGVDAALDPNPDEHSIHGALTAGRDVTISTPVHYYVADDYDPRTGALHVGNSGLARKGGAEWMTLQQISDRDGGVNGALYLVSDEQPSQGAPIPDYQEAQTVGPHGDVVNVREFDDPKAAAEGGVNLGPLGRLGGSRPKFRLVTYEDNTVVTEKQDPTTGEWSQIDIKVPQSVANRATKPETPPKEPKPPAFPHPPPAQPSPASGLQPIVDPKSGRQIGWYDPNTGKHIAIPQERPPKAPPSRKQIVTRTETDEQGNKTTKAYEYDPDTGTFAPAQGIPDEVTRAQPTQHVIGGRIYTTDAQGNVLGITDARTPEDLLKASLDNQKLQQELTPAWVRAQQNVDQAIAYATDAYKKGQITFPEMNDYVTAVKQAGLATIRGTTPFDEQKQLQTVQTQAAQDASANLRQRLATAGTVGTSFLTDILNASQHARLAPGQHLNIDPLALAKQYILENGGADLDALNKGLVARAGLGGGASTPPSPPAPIASGLLAGAQQGPVVVGPQSGRALPASAPAGV